MISPNHDNLNGENVINSIGALHHLNKNNNNPNQNLVTCIVGGDNQHYHFDNNEANELCNKLIEIKNNQRDMELNIVTSRRTSDRVKKIVVEHLNVEEGKITDSASFIDDLGADSLDTVELVMAFEEEFGIEIPDDAAENIQSFGDAVKFINDNS